MASNVVSVKKYEIRESIHFVYHKHAKIAITNLRFADEIDGLAGEEEELANLVACLDKASTAYGMKISAEKVKLMTNNTSGTNTEIKVNGQKLETVICFKYLAQL